MSVGANPEPDFEEGPPASFYFLFHVGSLVALLFALGNITVREGPWPCDLPLDPPLNKRNIICKALPCSYDRYEICNA